jgi:hypothetical protein
MAAMACAILILSHLVGVTQPAKATAVSIHGASSARLTIMTYNVAGLPFPAALDRNGPLDEIGMRLAGLRQQGRQPHIVLLQEAFTSQAKSIADLAGYRFIAPGPTAVDMVAREAPSMPLAYRSAESWSKGETEGKWADSGLIVMSDFPIVHVAKMAFAADACAGFDCLAAKGVLLTWIKVPGQDEPVVIADTHLNSRGATGVSDTRADAAFAEQLREARSFLAAQITPGASVVFGGDFNIGHVPQRIAQLGATPPLSQSAREATAQIQSIRPIDQDLRDVIERAKDKEFYRAGAGKVLRLTMLDVPFGIARGGYDLSDHLGYIASYAIR